MDLTLPLDNAAIELILPHRYPFLLVDRIIELEVDKRIVGIKNVSWNERHLLRTSDGRPVLPSVTRPWITVLGWDWTVSAGEKMRTPPALTLPTPLAVE